MSVRISYRGAASGYLRRRVRISSRSRSSKRPSHHSRSESTSIDASNTDQEISPGGPPPHVWKWTRRGLEKVRLAHRHRFSAGGARVIGLRMNPRVPRLDHVGIDVEGSRDPIVVPPDPIDSLCRAFVAGHPTVLYHYGDGAIERQMVRIVDMHAGRSEPMTDNRASMHVLAAQRTKGSDGEVQERETGRSSGVVCCELAGPPQIGAERAGNAPFAGRREDTFQRLQNLVHRGLGYGAEPGSKVVGVQGVAHRLGARAVQGRESELISDPREEYGVVGRCDSSGEHARQTLGTGDRRDPHRMHTRPHLRRDTRDVSRCPGVVVFVGFVFRDDQDFLAGANVRAVDEQVPRSLVEPCLQCQMLFHTVRHCFQRVGGYPRSACSIRSPSSSVSLGN